MKNIIKKVLCTVLSLSLVASSVVMFNKETVYAGETTQEEQYYYHLDCGLVYYSYKGTKNLNQYKHNGTYTLTPTIEFGQDIEVVDIYPALNWTNKGTPVPPFKINDISEQPYTHNIQSIEGRTKSLSWETKYKPHASRTITDVKIINGTGKKISWSYKAKLDPTQMYNVREAFEASANAVVEEIETTETSYITKYVSNENTAKAKQLLAAKKAAYANAGKAYAKYGANSTKYKELLEGAKAAERAYETYISSVTAVKVPVETKVNSTVTRLQGDWEKFQNEVYKFWGANNKAEMLMHKNIDGSPMYANLVKQIEQCYQSADDGEPYDMFLVFTPVIIKYKLNTKTCTSCGECDLPINQSEDVCSQNSCDKFGTVDCGCYQVAVPASPTGSCTDVITWTETKNHDYSCGKESCKSCPHTCKHTYTYKAILTPKATLTAAKPNGNSTTFKSGYGFMVNLNNSISVSQIANDGKCKKNKSKASEATITAPTNAQVQISWTVKNKEKRYTQPKTIALAKKSGGSTSSSFVTAANKVSHYNNAQIYTDVALAGTKQKPKKHQITVYTYGGSVKYKTFNREFCKTIPLSFTINGNMYEDDWTVDRLN